MTTKTFLAPTRELVENRITIIRDAFDEYWQGCSQIERLFKRTHRVPLPEDVPTDVVEIIRAPWAEDTVKRAMAIALQGSPTFSRTPLGRTEEDKQDARMVEAWSRAAWDQIHRQADRNVVNAMLQDILLFGSGWLELLYLPVMFEDYYRAVRDDKSPEEQRQVRQRARFPFLVRNLDPRSVGCIWDAFGMREAVVSVEKPRYQLLEEFEGVELTREGKLRKGLTDGLPPDIGSSMSGMAELTTIHTYYSRTHVAYYADGDLLETFPHKFGRPPIFEARGLGTSSNDPVLKYRSIISPVTEIIPILDSYLTMAHYYNKIMNYPAFFIETAQDPTNPIMNTGLRGQEFPFRPGKLTLLDPGDKATTVKLPSVNEGLTGQIQLLKGMIDSATPVPAILRGGSPGADTAGYAIRQLRQEARQTHQPALLGGAMCVASCTETMFHVTGEDVGEDVYVQGYDPAFGRRRSELGNLALSPKRHLRQDYRIAVSLRTDDDMHDIALLRAAAELKDREYLPHIYTLEHLAKVEDPEAVMEDLEVQRLLKHPQIEQMKLEAAIQRSGLRGLLSKPAPPPTAAIGMGGPPIDAGSPAGLGLPGTPLPSECMPPMPSVGPGMAMGPPPGGLGPIPGVPSGITPATLVEPANIGPG